MMEMAAHIEQPMAQARAYLSIAKEQVSAGDAGLARTTLATALGIASGMVEGERSSAKTEIIDAAHTVFTEQIKSKQFEIAKETLQWLNELRKSSNATSSISPNEIDDERSLAIAEMDAGHLDECLSTALNLSSQETRSEVCKILAVKYAAEGETEKAKQAINAIADDFPEKRHAFKDDAREALCEAQARAHQFPEALKTAALIGDIDEGIGAGIVKLPRLSDSDLYVPLKVEAFRAIVRVQLEDGDFEGALETVAVVPDEKIALEAPPFLNPPQAPAPENQNKHPDTMRDSVVLDFVDAIVARNGSDKANEIVQKMSEHDREIAKIRMVQPPLTPTEDFCGASGSLYLSICRTVDRRCWPKHASC
jgi:hypothetical protein